MSVPDPTRAGEDAARRDSGRARPAGVQASVVGWHRRRDVHTARGRRASGPAGSPTACARRALPRRACRSLCMAAGGCSSSASVRIAAASAVEDGDARSQCQVSDLGGALVARVRGGWVAVSPLWPVNDDARCSVAARHVAHTGRPQPPEPRPTLSPCPPEPQHTAVGTVPCDSSSALALFGGSQDATALSAPGRLGAGDRFAALVMEVGSSWYGPKGVGINHSVLLLLTVSTSSGSINQLSYFCFCFHKV